MKWLVTLAVVGLGLLGLAWAEFETQKRKYWRKVELDIERRRKRLEKGASVERAEDPIDVLLGSDGKRVEVYRDGTRVTYDQFGGFVDWDVPPGTKEGNQKGA